MALEGNSSLFDSVCPFVMDLEDPSCRKHSSPMERISDNPVPLINAILTIDDALQQVHIVNRLMVKGADVNGKDSLGKTPLMHAAILGYRGTVQALIDTQEIDLLTTDVVGNTALMMACRIGREQIMEMIICKAIGMGRDTLTQLLQTENTNGEHAFTIALRQSTECANIIGQCWVHLAKRNQPKIKHTKSGSVVELPVLKRIIRAEGYESPPHSSGSSPSPDEPEIRIKVGVKFLRRAKNRRSESVRSLDRMLSEKRNVAKSSKARQFFRVNTTGSPLTHSFDDFALIKREPISSRGMVDSLSNKFRDVMCTGGPRRHLRSEHDIRRYTVIETELSACREHCCERQESSSLRRGMAQRSQSQCELLSSRGNPQRQGIKLPPLTRGGSESSKKDSVSSEERPRVNSFPVEIDLNTE